MRAIQIVTKAVEEDEKKNYKDAYHLYCEGLQYFVPLITAEEDASKREHLQKQATNYMKRAEEIKRSAKQAYFLQRQISAAASASNGPNTSAVETTSSESEPKAPTNEKPILAAINPTSSFKQLCKFIRQATDGRGLFQNTFSDTMFASTPSVQDAMDIARQAELYSYEQNFPLALESFTSALNILVPLLKQEPNGKRKELLQQQVMDWMREAESIKGLVSAHSLSENSKTTHQHCTIQ